jgi:cell wall-associated NlpC family hydrolase
MRTEEKVKQVLAEAKSWIGTPWREGGSCVKGSGGGVDCSRFVWAVFRNAGLCGDFEFPVVPGIYCMERKNPSLILQFIFAHPEMLTEVIGDNFLPCDVVTFREGVVVHHMGIVLEDGVSMISARQPLGVESHIFKGDDYFNKRRNKAFRFVELS